MSDTHIVVTLSREEKLAILKALPVCPRGEALKLTPELCKDWFPCRDFDPDWNVCEAEAWCMGFIEEVLGTEVGRFETMPRDVQVEYFNQLKKFQYEFWRTHEQKITAVISAEMLEEYEAEED